MVETPGSSRPGVLLTEGKSYPGELYGSGCQAKPNSSSRALIEQSLSRSQAYLGVADKSAADWCGPLYQSANRLAHLYWLAIPRRSRVAGASPLCRRPDRPTSAVEWAHAMRDADRTLGLEGLSVNGAGHVLLPARGGGAPRSIGGA